MTPDSLRCKRLPHGLNPIAFRMFRLVLGRYTEKSNRYRDILYNKKQLQNTE